MKFPLKLIAFTVIGSLLLAACASAPATPNPATEPEPTATIAGGPVTLVYIGHDCFLLTAGDGTKIVMDPYKTGNVPVEISKFPDNLTTDLVTISRFHPGHSNFTGVGGKPRAIYQPGFDSAGNSTLDVVGWENGR